MQNPVFSPSPLQSPKLQHRNIQPPVPLNDNELNLPDVKRARRLEAHEYASRIEVERTAGHATLNDLDEARVYVDRVEAAESLNSIGRNINQAVAGGIIDALGPMMQLHMNQMNQRFFQVEQRMNLYFNHNLTIGDADRRRTHAIHINSFVTRNGDGIARVEMVPTFVAQPNLPNAPIQQLVPADPIPNEYPATKAALDRMSHQRVNVVLAYYNLPVDGTLPAKRARLREYLGLPPLR